MDLLERYLADSPGFRQREKRPFVTLSYAQSLDGSITLARGQPLRLSGPESLRLTHRLRAAHQGILVGVGTVLADDPQLSVRHAKGQDPQPIVLDSQLSFPITARLLNGTARPIWIMTTESAPRDRQEALERAGARVTRLAADAAGYVDLQMALEYLSEAGIKSLMVEGGARVITSFLRAGFVDRLVITIAPLMVGGLQAVEELIQLRTDEAGTASTLRGSSFPRLSNVTYEQLGRDLVVWATVDRKAMWSSRR